MNHPASLALFRAVVLPLLAAGLLAGCGHGPITIPPGVQEVHVVVDGDTVRLEPATARAGEVYLVLDNPDNPGANLIFIGRMTAPEETPGPLSDVELDRIVHGDMFQTSGESGFGIVTKLALAPGKYLFVTDDPMELAESSGGAVPQESMAVLQVLP
jgi:hypothetical protein